MGILDPPGAIRDVKRFRYPFSDGGPSGVTFATPADWCQRSLVLTPFPVGVVPSRARLVARNANGSTAPLANGDLVFSGVWIGPPALGTAHNSVQWNGDFASAPTQVASGFTVPSGSEAASPWFSASAVLAMLAGGTPAAISWGITSSAATVADVTAPFGACLHVATGSAAGAGATLMPDGTGSRGNQNSHLLGDVRLEIEFASIRGTVPIGIAIGDSITAGHTGGLTGVFPHENWVGAAALRNRCVIQNMGIGSTTATSWRQALTRTAIPAGSYQDRFDLTTSVPDFAIVSLGTNDASSAVSDTSATILSQIQQIVAALRALGIPRVYAATIIPRNFSYWPELVRNQVNTNLRDLPYGLVGVFDFDKATRLPGSVIATTCTIASGGNPITVNDAAGIMDGAQVYQSGNVFSGTLVGLNGVSGNAVTLTTAPTGSVSNSPIWFENPGSLLRPEYVRASYPHPDHDGYQVMAQEVRL